MSIVCCEIESLRDAVNADILEAAREGIITRENLHAIGLSYWQFLAILIMAEVDSESGEDPPCQNICDLRRIIEGNPKAAIENGLLTADNSHAFGIAQGDFWFLKALAESYA